MRSHHWNRPDEHHMAQDSKLRSRRLLQVQGNGFTGPWPGSDDRAGKRLRADGSINVRTDNAEAGAASYKGISPDSVCGGHVVNGLASPARRAPSGVSEWGTASDGTAVNSRDQLLSHQRATSSHPSVAGSPHTQQVLPLASCFATSRCRVYRSLQASSKVFHGPGSLTF
jgi:hypothetical protein